MSDTVATADPAVSPIDGDDDYFEEVYTDVRGTNIYIMSFTVH